MHETFEHTADLGLRIRAPSLETLIVEAAEALFSVIVLDSQRIQCVEKRAVEVAGDEPAYLLFDWLNELLYLFDSEHYVFGRFEARLESGKLHGAAWGEPLDRSRHDLDHEVKAITYHGLRVEQTPEGWLAEVIVDI